jgi:hypothetical protein
MKKEEEEGDNLNRNEIISLWEKTAAEISAMDRR